MDFTVDPALIERARSNDALALNGLIEAIWPEVYRVAAGIVHDEATAEDAAQDACASIARALSSLKNAAAFYGWMYRIAGRCAVEAAKARSRHAHDELRDIPHRDDTDTRLDLRSAIAALPLPQRAAVVLHYYAGLSSGEVAAILHLPSPTVRFHLMLARRSLRDRLSAGLSGGQEACERA